MSSTSRWTYEEYAKIPPDGMRHEIIDGEHIVNAAPNLNHQAISARIFHQLYTQVELASLGRVFYAPVDVELGPFDIVQPDIVLSSKPNNSILKSTKIEGVPELMIEILSPSNLDHDRVRKRELYRRFGVPEYWMVDPEHRCVEKCVLNETGRFISHRESNAITMTVPPGAKVDLRPVWYSES